MGEPAASFQCNVCGGIQPRPAKFDREAESCSFCGSNLRMRGLMYVLSMELFGLPLAVPDFPLVKSIRGLGLSDQNLYAQHLADRFDYRNTFYDRQPRLDIANPPAEETGRYNFIISSDVFEHVLPPVERAFQNAFEMLKPNGVLAMTVPYTLDPATREHYADLHEFGLAEISGELVLVNRTKSGEMQVFEKPVFHWSRGEPSLEVREFTETGLRGMLADAGFRDVRIYSESCSQFGIEHSESWSLPVAARKGEFVFRRESARDLLEHWRDVRQRMRRLERSYWVRIGRKLGLC